MATQNCMFDPVSCESVVCEAYSVVKFFDKGRSEFTIFMPPALAVATAAAFNAAKVQSAAEGVFPGEVAL